MVGSAFRDAQRTLRGAAYGPAGTGTMGGVSFMPRRCRGEDRPARASGWTPDDTGVRVERTPVLVRRVRRCGRQRLHHWLAPSVEAARPGLRINVVCLLHGPRLPGV